MDTLKIKKMEKFYFVYLLVCVLLIVGKIIYDFYLNKKEESPVPSDQEQTNKNRDEEELQHTYDTVNMWTNNCDQKAGILLAIIGVILTILVTSNFLKYLRTYIFYPFIDYWTGNSELAFSWSRFIVFFLLLVSAIMLIMSCNYLFKTVCANVDYQKMRKQNPELANKSYIFFGTISKMTYKDFKKVEVDYSEDLKSQIYVNSVNASNKFMNYNKSLYWFRFSLCVSCMLFIAIMIMK